MIRRRLFNTKTIDVFAVTGRVEAEYNALIDEHDGDMAPEARTAKLNEMRREVDAMRKLN